ncbi:MAG: glycosyltransferase [Bryobacterales bacterium]|nr:glycosyltransferase [Bryobacterales bacterium]
MTEVQKPSSLTLSVVVTSYETRPSLVRCLEALTRQKEPLEILVSDCSPVNPAIELAARFPSVRFLYFPVKRTVPELRWAAVREASGDLVAAMESRCVPSETWCAELVAAHRAHPDVPACGGPVSLLPGGSIRDLGIYLCEYGAFAPPVPQGPSAQLSGANLCYRRLALLECGDLMDAGVWEALMHERWLGQGRHLWLCGASIAFENTMALADTFRQRFHYAWSFASERVAGQPRGRAILRAATAPLIPLILIARLFQAARQKGFVGQVVRAFGWILIFQTIWAAGECAGYLLGAPREGHNY